MEGREKPNTDKYKKITNDWNYDAYITSDFGHGQF
jgi:hypothetical protein